MNADDINANRQRPPIKGDMMEPETNEGIRNIGYLETVIQNPDDQSRMDLLFCIGGKPVKVTIPDRELGQIIEHALGVLEKLAENKDDQAECLRDRYYRLDDQATSVRDKADAARLEAKRLYRVLGCQ